MLVAADIPVSVGVYCHIRHELGARCQIIDSQRESNEWLLANPHLAGRAWCSRMMSVDGSTIRPLTRIIPGPHGLIVSVRAFDLVFKQVLKIRCYQWASRLGMWYILKHPSGHSLNRPSAKKNRYYVKLVGCDGFVSSLLRHLKCCQLKLYLISSCLCSHWKSLKLPKFLLSRFERILASYRPLFSLYRRVRQRLALIRRCISSHLFLSTNGLSIWFTAAD